MRDGTISVTHHNFIAVGDVLCFEYGNEIPVDGLIFMANEVTTNEAAMTGESDERRKVLYDQCIKVKETK